MKKYVGLFSDGENVHTCEIRSEDEFRAAMDREQVVGVPGQLRWGALFDKAGHLECQIFLPEGWAKKYRAGVLNG